jgi:hypothetical protein
LRLDGFALPASRHYAATWVSLSRLPVRPIVRTRRQPT